MVGRIKKWWIRLHKLPMGKALFSFLLGKLIPYTGSINPRVEEAGPGLALVSIKDKKRVRNHLNSIHAIALSNLGEFTTGIALHFSLKNKARAILTELHTSYFKKARGKIFSQAKIDSKVLLESGSIKVTAVLWDINHQVVAKVQATWQYEKNL